MTGDGTEDRNSDGYTRVGTMAVLRIRPFTVLFLNAAVVFIGVMAQGIARGWLAYELTGSNAALGGVLLAFGVAMLVATPWGGVIADRMPKRLVLQISILILAGSSAWIGLAVAFGVIEYWMLLGASVLQAVAFALFQPARMAFLHELVPREALPSAVSLLLVNGEVNRVVGPAVSGVLIGAVSFGVEAVFLVSAALSLVGVLMTAALPPGHRLPPEQVRSAGGDLVDGIRYVAGRSELAGLLLCGVGVTMAGMPYLAFLPTVSSDLFDWGSAGYGILSATSAVGAVFAGLAIGRLSGPTWEVRALLVAGVAMALGLGGMALAPTFWVAVIMLLVVGGANLGFQTASQSLLLFLAAPVYHGRIQGLVMLSFGAFGVAALPLGVLADAIGLRWTFAGMAVAVLLAIGLFTLIGRQSVVRAVRARLQDPPDAEQARPIESLATEHRGH